MGKTNRWYVNQETGEELMLSLTARENLRDTLKEQFEEQNLDNMNRILRDEDSGGERITVEIDTGDFYFLMYLVARTYIRQCGGEGIGYDSFPE